MTDPIDIAALRARLAAATPGTWFAHADDLIGGWCVRIVDTPPSEGPGEVASFIREKDARFIAHARADVDALVAEVEHLRAEVHDLRLMAEEAARAENANAEDAKKERAAVVAWLEELAASSMGHDSVEELLYAARSIERGEHRREEDK